MPSKPTNPLMTAPREATVYLYPGDVEAKIEEFDERLEAAFRDDAQASATKRMSTQPAASRADEIAAEKDAYVDSVRKLATVMRLRAATTPVYERLLNEHPPRKEHKGDAIRGFNQSTFPAALIRACLVKPEVTDEQFDEWVESCSMGRFGAVYEAANDITTNEVDLPKSSAVSVLTRARERVSKPQPTTE